MSKKLRILMIGPHPDHCDIRFAEVFELCEYGKQLTPELEKELFPF